MQGHEFSRDSRPTSISESTLPNTLSSPVQSATIAALTNPDEPSLAGGRRKASNRVTPLRVEGGGIRGLVGAEPIAKTWWEMGFSTLTTLGIMYSRRILSKSLTPRCRLRGGGCITTSSATGTKRGSITCPHRFLNVSSLSSISCFHWADPPVSCGGSLKVSRNGELLKICCHILAGSFPALTPETLYSIARCVGVNTEEPRSYS